MPLFYHQLHSYSYSSAAPNKELLENVPCYCGCGEAEVHKSNYDCFIHENKKDGKAVRDNHRTKCGGCLEIATQSTFDLRSSKLIKQIRQSIDEKYKNSYAKPTPASEV
ncbi:PCYCGC motif-containing (lipo)protein [Priestia megaterium]|uniref:PCYCGC motif-containing (lipo)protein n=1 Tax=Priestia megaterium TaxID=1404 RepID=UPI0009B956CB|nr:PCYCGC motif-containing (lipo)protein [Priestia megaterium]